MLILLIRHEGALLDDCKKMFKNKIGFFELPKFLHLFRNQKRLADRGKCTLYIYRERAINYLRKLSQ